MYRGFFIYNDCLVTQELKNMQKQCTFKPVNTACRNMTKQLIRPVWYFITAH